MRVKPLEFQYVVEMLREIGKWNFEEILKIYMLFEGYPKYYVSLDDLSLGGARIERIIEELFLSEDAPYRNEGKVLLGDSRRKTFYSIIEAISMGKRKITDIAAYTRIKETQLPQYMDDLVYNLEIVIREKPIDAGPDTRRSLYYIKMRVMEFWFGYLHKNWSLVELGYTEQQIRIIRDDIDNFYATRFEFLARKFLVDLSTQNKLPIKIWKIGRWWRKKHEIDIVAIDDKQTILAVACRWGKISPKKALEEKEKTKQATIHIKMRPRKTIYGIIAKHVEKKETIRQLGYLAWDISDIEEYYTRQNTPHQE